jgi:ATP-dependent Clp protease ATP-binding subunit ClpB
MFNPLSKEEIIQVVRLQFARVKNTLDKNGIKLEMTDTAIQLVADLGFDPHFGARPIKRVMQRNLLNELSKMILAGQVQRDSKIIVDAAEGKLVFKNK